MGMLESDFRRGPRVVRMDIRTTYTRSPDRYHSEAYRPNQKTLWGVFDGDSEQTHLLYVFSGPGRLAGTTLLMHDRVAPTEPDGMWLYMRTFDGHNGPKATIELGSPLDDGTREIEWQYKIDQQPWHPFARNRTLVVDDPWLRVQA